jgi:hypothetical protein
LQRWLSRDPIGEIGFRCCSRDRIRHARGEDGNLYCYVANDPLLHIDPFGLSQRDVTRIYAAAIKAFFSLCNDCKRCDNGFDGLFYYNNDLMISFGAPFLGCNDQSLFAETSLFPTLNSADDRWTPDIPRVFNPLPHQYLVLKSSNAADPIIYVDFYNGTITAEFPAENLGMSMQQRVEIIKMTCKPRKWFLSEEMRSWDYSN